MAVARYRLQFLRLVSNVSVWNIKINRKKIWKLLEFEWTKPGSAIAWGAGAKRQKQNGGAVKYPDKASSFSLFKDKMLGVVRRINRNA